LASDVGAELARWLENTKRLVDQLAATAERQDQLEAQVAALERDNEQLRRTLDELRSEIQLLRTERASIAEILRTLAEDLSARQNYFPARNTCRHSSNRRILLDGARAHPR
jgi:ABC-type transporter Mla subunit MlaD